MKHTGNIINLRTVGDIGTWLNDPNNVYIGRNSKWGNPYRVRGINGRYKAVASYKRYLQNNENLRKCVKELKGKRLGCWCSPKRCHGEILHQFAGNTPEYQRSSKMSSPTNEKVDAKLDQQVTEALQTMNNFLEDLGHDISGTHLPIPNNVDTPSLLTISTNETSKLYETLLESIPSSNNSFDLTANEVSLQPPCNQHVFGLTKSEKFELDYKLKPHHSNLSQSLQSLPSLSSPQNFLVERKCVSAPVSPIKRPDDIFSTNSVVEDTITITPNSFQYNSTTRESNSSNEQNECQDADATRKILVFLANKVDLLSVNINTIQYNLNKITETLQMAVQNEMPETVRNVEKAVYNKYNYMESKLDNYKSITDKEFQEIKMENAQLKEKLENYILQETERNNLMKECINNSPTLPCITDILPLREELEQKLLDIDTRLIECEQYSRRENLIISGIPNSVTQSHLERKVIDILALIGLNLIPDDISACHRLYNPPGSQYPAKVVVRFCNRKVVNFCLQHREDLQHKAYQQLRLNLRFFDSLCAKNEETIRICKWLRNANKIHDFYIRNGFVKIVTEEHGRPVKISHPELLRKKFDGVPTVI